jgi:uncharacterized protein (UPF0305 family)
MKHLNFSYKDARNIEIRYRKWFIERLLKELEAKNKAMKKGNGQQIDADSAKGFKQFEDMINKKFDNQ